MPRPLLSFIIALAFVAAGAGCTHRNGPRIPSDTMDETAAMPTSASASRGEALFVKNCAACHGLASAGPIGPWLHGERTRKDTSAVIEIIKHPDPPMPKLFPGTLRAQDVADLAAYVESL
jgi:mono/diheme cytochrome c family protein